MEFQKHFNLKLHKQSVTCTKTSKFQLKNKYSRNTLFKALPYFLSPAAQCCSTVEVSPVQLAGGNPTNHSKSIIVAEKIPVTGDLQIGLSSHLVCGLNKLSLNLLHYQLMRLVCDAVWPPNQKVEYRMDHLGLHWLSLNSSYPLVCSNLLNGYSLLVYMYVKKHIILSLCIFVSLPAYISINDNVPSLSTHTTNLTRKKQVLFCFFNVRR